MTSAAAKSGRHLARGSAWAIALRWCVRGTGLLSTLILARLLAPSDFGIVAMSMLVVGALEVLSETGQRLAIIRHPDPGREHYDSAWTISIMIGLGLSVAIFAVAPLTVDYFHEPRAITVIRCLALRTFISGFENIGVVEFRRGLNFRSDFRYAVAQRLISFCVTISAAVVLRNYWALVIGIMISRVAAVALSYAMHPFRPRICFSKVAELWSFSIWALVKHVGNYLTAKADEFVVGGMTAAGMPSGASAMGRYNVAADVAASPTDELIAPVVATLFPVMSTIQGDTEALKRLFLRVLSWSAVVCSSTSVGVALTSNEIVTLVLGSQWLPIRTIMPWIALSQGLLSLGASVYVVFDVLGRPRYSAYAQWTRLVLLVCVLVPLSWRHSLDLIATGRLAVACVITPTLFWSLRRVLPVRLPEIVAAIWRPITSAALMAAAVSAVALLHTQEPVARLVEKVFVGASVYAGALLFLWRAAGSPPGPEEDVVTWFMRLWRRMPFSRDALGSAAGTQTHNETLEAGSVETHPPRGMLRICLYTAIPHSEEFKPHPRSALSLAKRILVRAMYRFSWRCLRTTRFTIGDWIDHNYTNRGDIAIRDTITKRLNGLFPDHAVEFVEIGWGGLSAETINDINRTCDLFVIGGGGFVFLGKDGLPSGKWLDDLPHLRQVRCPRVAYGIGINSLLAGSGNIATSSLPAPTQAQIGALADCLDLTAVRGRLFHDALKAQSAKPAFLTGDPVFIWGASESAATRSLPSAPNRCLEIGINFAVHGPKSAETFRAIFPESIKALRVLQSRYRARFHYFMHCDTEQIAVELLRIHGIRIARIVTGRPEELSAAYAGMDLVLCQMLHSAILASANDTPALCLAYDVKNFAFYDLIECPDLCVPPGRVTSATIIDLVQGVLQRREDIASTLRARRQELRSVAEQFERSLRTLVLAHRGEADFAEATLPSAASPG